MLAEPTIPSYATPYNGPAPQSNQQGAGLLAQLMAQQQAQQQQNNSAGMGSPTGGIDPMKAMQMYQQFGGSGSSGGGLFGGLFGGSGTTGVTAANGAAHTGSAMGAGGGSSGGLFGGLFGGGGSGAGAGASGASSLLSFWPAAVVAAAVGNEMYQKNTGNRQNQLFPGEQALEGRALYKDAPVWGAKADKVIPGWGNDIRLAGDLSSPADMFRSSTYSDIWHNLKSGGLLGGLIKKVF